MQFFIIISCLCLASIETGNVQETCKEDGVIVNGVYHDKELIKSELDLPRNLAVDKKTNTLYFGHNAAKSLSISFKAASIDLTNNHIEDISNIVQGFSATVDQETGTVYLGGEDGIYTLNNDPKSATKVMAQDKDIIELFYKDSLFFITYPQWKLYECKDENCAVVPEFENLRIYNFAVDKNDVRFFTNVSTLFTLEKGETVGKAKHFDVQVTAIAINGEGNAYLCGRYNQEYGIYTLDKDNVKKVAIINNIIDMTFDKDDHIIYSTRNDIFRLIPKNCTGRN